MRCASCRLDALPGVPFSGGRSRKCSIGLHSKRAQLDSRLIVFVDEPDISERPTRVRT
jgi:hypothetical protein